MTIKFAAKEIPFLKADSDDETVTPPETYFSDMLLSKTNAIKNFENRLEQMDIPGDNFLCAVIKIVSRPRSTTLEKAKKTFETTFNSFLDNKRGIWEVLDASAFSLVFWDYQSEEKALALLISLKNRLSSALDTDILTGVACYPFHDFAVNDVFGNALKAIDHAAFFGPDAFQEFNAVSLNISADRLYQLGRFKQATREYERGLEIAPRDANLMNSLGVCYGIMDNLEKAKELFKNAAAVAPKEAMIIYNIGLVCHIDNHPDKAAAYLKKAHGMNSTVFEIELLLGQILYRQGHPKQAMPHLESAARLNPDSALAFRIQGEIYLANQQPDKAATRFNTAIKLNPSDAVSLSGYARSLERQNKNLPIALTFAKNSIALEPDNLLFKERLSCIQTKIDMAARETEQMKTA